MRQRGLRIVSALILAQSLAGASYADDCHVPRFHFCENCETPVSVRVAGNNQCIVKIRSDSGLEEMKIVEEPKHGIVGVEESTRPHSGELSHATNIIYQPAKGYTGQDSFAAHVSFFRAHGLLGGVNRYETTARFAVDVVDYHETDQAQDYLKQVGAGAGVEITTTWTSVTKQISPTQGLYRTRLSSTIRLSGTNAVSTVLFQNGAMMNTAKGVLGSNMTIEGKTRPDITQSVVIDNGSIVLTADLPTYTVHTAIRTNGHDKCSATREYRLKPGHQYFEVVNLANGRPETDEDLHAEDVACAITVRN